MWVSMSTANTNLDRHVTVIPDPAVDGPGRAWIEEFSVEQWRALRGLIGQRVRVASHRPYYPEDVIGKLVQLTDSNAVVDAGGNDHCHLRWVTITPEREETS